MAGPAQAFHSAANYGAGYELHFCASSPEISSAQGLIFKTETELPDIGRNDLIVVPGQWSKHIKDGKLLNARIIAWLRERTNRKRIWLRSVPVHLRWVRPVF